MSKHLIDPAWEPKNGLWKLDADSNGFHVRLVLSSKVVSHLAFPRGPLAKRKLLEAVYLWGKVRRSRYREPLNPIVAYHLRPLGDRDALARAESLDSYLQDVRWSDVAFVGATVQAVLRGVTHHDADLAGGMSLGKARDIVGDRLRLDRNGARRAWRNLEPVAHLCASLVYCAGERMVAERLAVERWATPTRIFQLLECASAFEGFVTSHKVERRQAPIIARSRLWSVRRIVDMPIDLLKIAPFPADELSLLQARRAHRDE